MADEATKLVVRLEAKLDTLEKGLKKAGVLADDAVRGIEDKFSKANPTFATAFGNAIGDAISKGVEIGIEALEKLQARFTDLQKTAEVAAISLKDAFALQEALKSVDDANKAIVSLATQLDRARRGEDNYLTKLLKVNGSDIKSIGDAEAALFRVADIISRLPTEVQKIEAAKALGIPEDLVDRLSRGSDALRKAKDNAAAAAPDLEKLAEISRRFQNAWKAAVEGVRSYFASNFEGIRTTIVSFITTTIEELKRLEGLGATIRGAFGIEGKTGLAGQAAEALGTVADAFNREPMKLSVNKNLPASKLPPLGGGGGGSKRESLDAFKREERRARERAEALDVEAASIGKTNAEREKAIETLRLEQMAKRENIPVTDKLRGEIDKLATTYADSTQKLDNAKDSFREMQELQQFAGNQLVSVFADIARGASTVEDALKRVVDALLQASLQAMILGQGPLAGLFGSSPTPGSASNIGGLMGSLGGLFGRAGGGSVEAGRSYLIGERGPELFRPGSPGIVVPNSALARGASGGSSVNNSRSYQIDARGAQAGVADQIVLALKAYDRQLANTLPSRLKQSDMRRF